LKTIDIFEAMFQMIIVKHLGKDGVFSAGAAKESDFYQRIRLLRAWEFPADDPAELFE